MNFEGLIEFNKYTLAIAAASFVYSLEKLVPLESQTQQSLLLLLLGLLLLSTLLGIALFAAATAALHGDSSRRQRIQQIIPWLGISHGLFLCIGMILLGYMLYDGVIAAPTPTRAGTAGFS